MNGWFKFHRKTFENPIIMKDAETLSVWVWLLGNATFDERRVLFGGTDRKLRKGELVTTTKFIANELKINESKVNRILKLLEKEKQIEKQTTSRNTLIYIVNWEKYQSDEKQNEEQMANERQTSDEQVTTIQESNKDKEEKKDTHLTERKQIIEYLNQKCGTKYRHGSDVAKKHINARLNEGYSIEDFIKVIDKKYKEWHGTEHEKYLTPETLFGNKFEKYLNQKINEPKPKNKFNDFPQMEYDFDLLEKLLMEDLH